MNGSDPGVSSNAESPSNVRSPFYFVANAGAVCTACGRLTHVVAVALPEVHELSSNDADSLSERAWATDWHSPAIRATLFYVRHLPQSVQRRIAALTSSFRLAESPATGDAYWMNHCEHCGAAQEDHDLHCEPGGAFMPMSPQVAAGIQLLQILEPFNAAAGGYSVAPEFL